MAEFITPGRIIDDIHFALKGRYAVHDAEPGFVTRYRSFDEQEFEIAQLRRPLFRFLGNVGSKRVMSCVVDSANKRSFWLPELSAAPEGFSNADGHSIAMTFGLPAAEDAMKALYEPGSESFHMQPPASVLLSWVDELFQQAGIDNIRQRRHEAAEIRNPWNLE